MSSNTISEVVKLKRRLYVKLVKLTIEGKLVEEIEMIPQKMVRADTPRYRCCEFKERAIFSERIKVALGFNTQNNKEKSLEDLAAEIDSRPKTQNIVEVIETACDSCPIDKYLVTDACRNCVAHKCVNACPVNAIVIIQNKAFIDQSKCIECGKCAAACSYNAILENDRPCSRACAVDAITSNENRQAKIDEDKCLSCGSCIEACPFGAIAEKSDLVQVAKELVSDNSQTVALLAPSFVGQFGFKISAAKINFALKKLGFQQVIEVAEGADKVAVEESRELKEMIKDEELLLSSCCTAFKELVENEFKGLKENLSQTDSPMAVSASAVKKRNEKLKTVFIGPCTAKKKEALANDHLDYVLTFEELLALITAFEVNLAEIDEEIELNDASHLGRQFAFAGGLEKSLNEVIDIDFKSKQVDGLEKCYKELLLIKAEKYDYNFLEGMACSGGCVGGPAAMINNRAARNFVSNFAAESKLKIEDNI